GCVQKAYLARVDFGPDSSPGVALCLKAEDASHPRLVKEIGRVFASLFNSWQHLDIAFIKGRMEQQVSAVCAPFFVARQPAETPEKQLPIM
ncbi:MAG TPA: hypothetical protein VI685_29265, partial [Candidatus Angelobacter sp.]